MPSLMVDLNEYVSGSFVDILHVLLMIRSSEVLSHPF